MAVDRSGWACAAARAAGSTGAVRADNARLPVRSGSVDLVVALFSSVAHDGPEALASELEEASRCVRPGGALLLDLPDPSAVARGLVPRSERPIGGLRLREARRLSGGGACVHKRVELTRGPFRVARWFEHLPLVPPERLLDLARHAGWIRARCVPGQAVAGFDAGRVLLVARAPDPSGSLS